MSEAKALPDNIKAFEQNPEFKKTYDNNTVDKLEMQLIEADVEFLSTDNKAALVWRLLDHQGQLESNDDAETKDDAKKAIDSAENVDSSTDDDVRVDTTTGGNSGGDSNTSNSNESVKPDESEADELEYVSVKNNGGFNMLEPATGTLVTAGETTKVYIKGYATKNQVLRNIAQYNHTRGNKLVVTN